VRVVAASAIDVTGAVSIMSPVGAIGAIGAVGANGANEVQREVIEAGAGSEVRYCTIAVQRFGSGGRRRGLQGRSRATA
jgi:hypothetical protein